jgi:hypothetical protein
MAPFKVGTSIIIQLEMYNSMKTVIFLITKQKHYDRCNLDDFRSSLHHLSELLVNSGITDIHCADHLTSFEKYSKDVCRSIFTKNLFWSGNLHFHSLVRKDGTKSTSPKNKKNIYSDSFSSRDSEQTQLMAKTLDAYISIMSTDLNNSDKTFVLRKLQNKTHNLSPKTISDIFKSVEFKFYSIYFYLLSKIGPPVNGFPVNFTFDNYANQKVDWTDLLTDRSKKQIFKHLQN